MSGIEPGGVDGDLAERLAFVAASLNRRLRPPADALTHVGLSALASVQRAGSVRPGDLARIEGIGAPGTTRLVADLERRGLVTRDADPDDGRSHRVRITPAGEAEIGRARTARAEGVAAILAGTAGDDRAVLERAVGVLERALLASGPVTARTG